MQVYPLPAKRIITSFLIAAFVVQLLSLPTLAVAQEKIEPKAGPLTQAQELYFNGKFDQAIEEIHQYLKQAHPDKSEKMQVYILLSKTFIAKKEPDTAREIVRKILSLEPGYQPTLNQEKPSYVNLVNSVRSETTAETAPAKKTGPGFKINWLWVGGSMTAAAAVVGTVMLAKDGNSKSNSLPEPPALPK